MLPQADVFTRKKDGGMGEGVSVVLLRERSGRNEKVRANPSLMKISCAGKVEVSRLHKKARFQLLVRQSGLRLPPGRYP
jgi:hypothetical protein